MNRGYISTPCPSELILVIKMTSSEVLPAHAGPMTSASTATHGGALSLAPAPGPPPPGRPPHFSLSLGLLGLSFCHALACEKGQGELKLPRCALPLSGPGAEAAWPQAGTQVRRAQVARSRRCGRRASAVSGRAGQARRCGGRAGGRACRWGMLRLQAVFTPC